MSLQDLLTKRKTAAADVVQDNAASPDNDVYDAPVIDEPRRETASPAKRDVPLPPPSTPPWLQTNRPVDATEADSSPPPAVERPSPAPETTMSPPPKERKGLAPPWAQERADVGRNGESSTEQPQPRRPSKMEVREDEHASLHRAQYDPLRPSRSLALSEQAADSARLGAIEGWNERYIVARKAWDERFSTHAKREVLWQRIAFGCLVVTAISVIGAISLSNRMTIVPHIVEVDKDGAIVGSYGSEHLRWNVSEVIIRSVIERWIRSFRTVTIDRSMQDQLLFQTDTFLPQGSQSRSRVQAVYKSSSPYARSKNVVVQPEVSEIRKLSDNTWYVQWEEKITPVTGGDTRTEKFTATLTTGRGAIDERRLRWNPLGVYILQLDFTGTPVER